MSLLEEEQLVQYEVRQEVSNTESNCLLTHSEQKINFVLQFSFFTLITLKRPKFNLQDFLKRRIYSVEIIEKHSSFILVCA